MRDVKKLTINAMAPLCVGAPKQQTWAEFSNDWKEGRDRGLHGIAADFWWEDFEPEQGKFCWDYGDKMFDLVIPRDGTVAAVFAKHRCGGNVGDTVNKYLPKWAWKHAFDKLEQKYGVGKYTMDALKFVSSQGNASDEYFSYWATELVLDLWESSMRDFLKHFGGRAKHLSEINVSLGVAGERRFPSYNSHDKGTDYPTEGAMQCFSPLALLDFELWAITRKRYGSKEAVEEAWGRKLDHATMMPKDMRRFFRRQEHIHTQFGRDLMEWYCGVPSKHAKLVLGKALDVFAADDSAMKGIDIGAKVPGVHWRMGRMKNGELEFGDRLAEISAGLIRPGCDWFDEDEGRGYREMINTFKELQGRGSRVVMHFTCLEMPDGDGPPEARSMANLLVRCVGEECKKAGVPRKGENALAWNLPNKRAWELMRGALTIAGGAYEGLTLLRLSDCLASDTAREEFGRTLKWVNENQPK